MSRAASFPHYIYEAPHRESGRVTGREKSSESILGSTNLLYSCISPPKFLLASWHSRKKKNHQHHHPCLHLCSLSNKVAIPVHTGLIATLYQNVGNTHNSTTLQPQSCRVSQAISGIAFLPRGVGAGGGSIIPNIAHFLKTVSDD